VTETRYDAAKRTEVEGVVKPFATKTEAMERARHVATLIGATAAERDRHAGLPIDALRIVADHGLLSLTVPEEYGGAGLPLSATVESLRIIAIADPNVGQILQNHYASIGAVEVSDLDHETKKFFENEALEGAQFGTVSAEKGGPNALSNTARLTRVDEHGLHLNGVKFYSTGIFNARWMTVTTLDPEGERVFAAVRREAEGVRIVDDWTGMGQRTTGSGTTEFRDVRVDAGHVFRVPVPAENLNLVVPFTQALHAALEVGIARAALTDAVSFVRERSRPWIDAEVPSASLDPYVMERVGELSARIEALEALLRTAGDAIDMLQIGEKTELGLRDAQILVAQTKSLGAAVALDASTELFALCGARSALIENDFDRHWRNSRTHSLHAPVRWTNRHVGNWILNGIAPPQNGHI
jgi:SfnB family sulfur acquisition oxidoreductase